MLPTTWRPTTFTPTAVMATASTSSASKPGRDAAAEQPGRPQPGQARAVMVARGFCTSLSRSRVVASKMPRDRRPGAVALHDRHRRIAASVRRSSSSVLRVVDPVPARCSLLIDRLHGQPVMATFGSSWSAACAVKQGLLQHAWTARLDAAVCRAGLDRARRAAPRSRSRVIGSSCCRRFQVCHRHRRQPVTRPCSACSLVSVLFLDHRRQAGRQAWSASWCRSRGCVARRARGLRKSAAACGGTRVWQVSRLPQDARGMDEVSR